MTRGVVILGSTGSIGTQALDVLSRHRDEYRVVALAAGPQHRAARASRPPSSACRADLARACADDPDALAELAAHPDADVVLNAVVGFAGLPATLAALRRRQAARAREQGEPDRGGPGRGQGARRGRRRDRARRLRALGDLAVPARRAAPSEVRAHRAHRERRPVPRPHRERARATSRVADALAHPTWNMGAKITIDSSTLMNKGLEVIEAHELFGVGFDRIDVVVHPQSIVHSMVEFCDGATIAQLSMPDMRLPIGLALGAPDRLPEAVRRDRLGDARRAHFEVPDLETFRCLGARLRGRAGRAAPRPRSSQLPTRLRCEAFLAGRIAWTEIAAIVEEMLNAGAGNADEVADVLEADRRARDERDGRRRTGGVASEGQRPVRRRRGRARARPC